MPRFSGQVWSRLFHALPRKSVQENHWLRAQIHGSRRQAKRDHLPLCRESSSVRGTQDEVATNQTDVLHRVSCIVIFLYEN